MENEFKISDIYRLETLLKTKVQELQYKADSFDKLNVDLNQCRQMLYNEQMLLNQERRQVRELELQLKISHERIDCLEKDKLKYQQEKIKLQVNCDSATKERDSLLKQAQGDKIENLQLSIKIQHLEEELLKKDSFTNALGLTLEQLKNEVTNVTQNAKSNILKLEKEQDNLRRSLKVINKVNQRLLVVGMCSYHHDRDQKETIKYFQKKLNELPKNIELNEMENCFSGKMAVFDGTNESESDDDLNKQMEAFIEELQNED